MNKATIISISISVLLVGGMLWFANGGLGAGAAGKESGASAVSVVDGRQTIDIFAKGGYSPRVIAARAGIPTTLRVKTSGTFDCSASLVIPSLSYQKFLKPSGIEEVAISAEQAQGTLRGLCSMGMYGFEINFR